MDEKGESDKSTERKVRVLGVSCSPRQKKKEKNGSRSDKMLNKLFDYVRSFGGETQRIKLVNRKIKICEGCYSEKEDACTYPCIHEDETNKVLSAIIEADALVLATPVYWGAPSSLLRILVEKMTSIENNRQALYEKNGCEPLEGKIAVLLASEDSEGASMALSQIAWGLNQMGFLLIPNGLIFEPALLEKRIVRAGLRIIGVRKFEWIENSIRLAARNIVLLTRLIKENNYRFDDYAVIEPRI